MIPTSMFRNVRGFVVAGLLVTGSQVAALSAAGLLVACAADPGAQPLQPTSTSTIALPQGVSASNGGGDDMPGVVDAQSGAPPQTGAPAADSLSDGPNSAPPAGSGAPSEVTNTGAAPGEPAAFELPRGTTVLHVGDSFAGALGPDLNRELGEHGVRGVLKQEKATYIPTWASRKELSGYLKEYNPDLILVTLGGNELGIVHPEERAETVQRLVKRFEGIPCVWIGIPLWKGANPALLEVIRNNVSPCRYLDSSALVPDLERAKDKIHPSLSARKVWALAVVRWLAQQRLPNADKPWALK